MDDFAAKFDCVFSELQITKTCNALLRKLIIDLEGSSQEKKWLRSALLLWRYQIKRTGLTGNKISPDDLQACHPLKKKENVILKFKSSKLKYKL